MRKRLKYPLSTASLLLMLGLLAYIAPHRNAIRLGELGDYWEFACGVELESFDGYFRFAQFTGTFPTRDGWSFYYYQEHHGRHVFKLRNEAALASAQEAMNLLRIEIRTTAQKGYTEELLPAKNLRRTHCLSLAKGAQWDKQQFVDAVNKTAIGGPNADSRDRNLQSFARQWDLAQRYWLTLTFEALFLSFWWLFTWDGGPFGKFNKKLSHRLAFSPLLLMVPHYLGYAPFLFTFGPSGGVLYPLIAALVTAPFAWIPYNNLEIAILQHLPQPLMYISQLPFEARAMSFRGSASPSVLCLYAAIVLILGRVLRRRC